MNSLITKDLVCGITRDYRNRSIVLLLFVSLGTGCSSTPGQPHTLPPTTDISTSTDEPPLADPSVTEQEPPTPEDSGSSASNNAALVLLAQSETLRAKGQLPGAVALVERAIRLEPRRSDLWIQLARLRHDTGELDAAEQHATRAIALSREDSAEHRAGWLLMADIAEARGDTQGATMIRSRWRNQRG